MKLIKFRSILSIFLTLSLVDCSEWNSPVSYKSDGYYRPPAAYNTKAEYNHPAEYNSRGEYNNGADMYNTIDPYSSNNSEWDSLPFEVESVDDCTSSVVDSLALVSQLKSLFQVIVGDVKGARCTQINFSRTNPAAALVRSGIEAASGDGVSAGRTLEKMGQNTYSMVKGLPVVGHGIGVGHYIAGETQTGNEIMKSATRAIPVIVGGTFGGPAGAVAAGAAYDGTVTGIESAVHGEYRPFGVVSSATNIVTGITSAGEAYDAGFGLVMDGVSGHMAKTAWNKNTQPGSKFGSSNPANFERILSDTDSMASVQTQSSGNLSPASGASSRSSIGSVTAALDDLQISPLAGPKTISARSSWEAAPVNSNVNPGLNTLPVTQYNCAYCTVAALKRTSLNKLLDNLNRMDVDGPKMAVSGPEVLQVFRDAGYPNVATQGFPVVPNSQPMIPLQNSPVSNYLNNVLAPGTKEVYGLAYTHAEGGGHVVVLKAWKTPAGEIGSRIIDFQQPVGSNLRFINGQLPSGQTNLIFQNGLSGTGGSGTGAMPRGTGAFAGLSLTGTGFNGGMPVSASRLAQATFPATVGNINRGNSIDSRNNEISVTTSTSSPLLKAFPSFTKPLVDTVPKAVATVASFPGFTPGRDRNVKVNSGFPTRNNVMSGFPG